MEQTKNKIQPECMAESSLSLSDLEQQRRGAKVLRLQPGPDRCQVRCFGPHLHMKEKDKKSHGRAARVTLLRITKSG